ncbi:MAG: nitroreductase family protein, partial [Alphaproteobacteria bacterium]|nr:nitroreductase family protein [Alphaproteobacteria bacterium]
PALARILGRRTIRRYRDAPVPDGLLTLLLACAQSAPSKSDLQQCSILVVKDEAKRATIAGWLPGQPWVGQAPVFLVFLADMRRARRLGEIHGKPNENDNVDGFLNATVDAALAMQTFALAADAAGLGCCCISMIRDHIEAATPLLGLPPGVFPIAGLCVGWPEGPGRMSMRLPPEAVVHVDRYDDSALPGTVDAYDRRRHARAPIAASGQRAVERWGTAEFCGWSDNVARQLSLPERAGFRAFLARHGVALA